MTREQIICKSRNEESAGVVESLWQVVGDFGLVAQVERMARDINDIPGLLRLDRHLFGEAGSQNPGVV